ncbi:MAG: DUF502 domain-containing protein [Hyphomicrobiales bacterium]|nr:DUF502 domain-containing protein [Hyphomicrobiales bacterium]
MSWLRRTFLTGIIVTVPLIVTLVTLWWIFQFVDAFATPIATRLVGRTVPGLGVLITALMVLIVGAISTNVFGRRLLRRAESWLLQVPVFKTIYAPVRQLVAAFSPDNDAGFKKVVLIDDPRRGMLLGFVTREFRLDRPDGADALVAVYVPTNHLYLGDIVIVPRAQALYPDLSVEEGIRIFLTGGMALPGQVTEVTQATEAGTVPVQGRRGRDGD